MNLATLNSEVLAAGESTPGERFAELFSAVNAAIAFAKEIKVRLDAAALEHIEAAGEFTVGGIRYFASKEKKVTCISVHNTFSVLLSLGGPDAVEQCLAANAFKNGATRTKLLELEAPEQYYILFSETWGDKLSVKAVDERFLPKG